MTLVKIRFSTGNAYSHFSRLAVKTGKSAKDKRAGKGTSAIPGNCPHHHHPSLIEL